MSAQILGLFPVPFMRVERLLGAGLIDALLERAEGETLATNARSTNLSHTRIMRPDNDALYAQIAALVMPRIVQFGATLFGEMLEWTVKEMWINVLEQGGYQSLHAHANSFISGVLYLTPVDPSAHTVFHRAMGTAEFVFSNNNERSRVGSYNGTKWVLPKVLPGDLALWPSYLLHEVPANMGNRRVSIAFNAIPSRLDSWGYAISLNA